MPPVVSNPHDCQSISVVQSQRLVLRVHFFGQPDIDERLVGDVSLVGSDLDALQTDACDVKTSVKYIRKRLRNVTCCI